MSVAGCMSVAALLVLRRCIATGCMFAFLVMAKLWALIKRGIHQSLLQSLVSVAVSSTTSYLLPEIRSKPEGSSGYYQRFLLSERELLEIRVICIR